MKDFSDVFVSGLSPSVEQENYLGQMTPNFTSLPLAGAAQQRNSTGMHTILLDISAFSGTISFEATLDVDQNSAVFIPVNLTKILDSTVAANVSLDDTTGLIFYQLAGRYTWLRMQVKNFTAGTINSVRMKIY